MVQGSQDPTLDGTEFTQCCVYVVLFCQAWKMQVWASHEVFKRDTLSLGSCHAFLQGGPEKATVWSWGISCHGDPRILEMSQPWDICWEQPQTQSGASPKEWICVLQATELEHRATQAFWSSVSAQAKDARHGTSGDGLFHAGCQSSLVQSFFAVLCSFPLEGECLHSAFACEKYARKKLYRGSLLKDYLTLWEIQPLYLLMVLKL